MKKLIISFLLVLSYVLAAGQNMPGYWVPVSGTNTYTTNITGFTAGYTYKVAWVSFTNGNTGASTIVIGPNNVSAAPIRKWDGDSWEPLVSGDIPTITGGARAILTYNNTGSFFELNLLATTDGGVESVSGNVVDNADPANPTISAWPSEGAYSLTDALAIDGATPFSITTNGITLTDNVGSGLVLNSSDGTNNVNIYLSPTETSIDGPAGFQGLKYGANYTANFSGSPRSIPDVGFVDARYTASNGLTKTGTNFTMGGTMNSNIVINSSANNTNTFSIGSTTRPTSINFNAGDALNSHGAISITSTTTSIARHTTNPMSFVMSASGMVMTDLAYMKGLTYAADYSANFSSDNRSIPDVGWVNSQINNNAWPLTGTRAFTGNAVIDGGGFNATIGQSGNRMGNFRVWSNGTIGLDGSTSSFLQSGNNTANVTAAGGLDINVPDGDVVINTPTVEMNVDTDYRFYNTANNNFATWGSAGFGVNLDEVDGTGSFAVNDSDSPLLVIGALGDITFYNVPEYDVAPTLSNDLQLTHKLYVDSKAPLAMPSVTYTANRVAGTADIGKIVYMNVTTSNTFTINSGVFPVGTFLNVRVLDEATTAVAGASVTINAQSGSLVLSSSGINVFYQTSADVWELYNGSPFTLQNTTLTGLVTWTMGGNGLLLDGGDFAVTGTGGYQFSFDDDNGTNIDFPTNATGDLYFRKSTGFLDRLPIGSAGQVLTVSGGLPSWQAAGGVSDGDKGDITVSASGATWTVDNSTITYAKMQNAAGGTRILGRAASSAGGINEIVATADGQVLRRASGSLGFGAVDLADTDAVTGVLPTANGGSLSGTYTPTLTNVANLDGSTAYACQYMRVGNVVTVSGRFDVDITTISTLTQLDISLPIASALTAANQAGGTASTVSNVADHAGIMADATNDRVSVIWNTSSASAFSMFFSFTYLVQ